jgi:hypothetical protein
VRHFCLQLVEWHLRRARSVELDPEPTADADGALHADFAAHHLDQALGRTSPMPVPCSVRF